MRTASNPVLPLRPVAKQRRPEGDARPGAPLRATLRHALPTLEWILTSDLPADPATYEVLYAYAAGQTAGLNQALDRCIERGQLDAAALERLHREFFVSAAATEARDAAGEIGAMAAALARAIDTTAVSAQTYQRDLAQSAETLVTSGERAELLRVIARLLVATTDMREQNRKLSAVLQDSADQIADLQSRLAASSKESAIDPLTGIANRRHFGERLDEVIRSFRDHGRPFSLLMADIDHFKRFNDAHGHVVGDRILALVADVIRLAVRGQDLPARYGGEEFAILLPDTTLEQALAVAENIRNAVSRKDLLRRSTGERLGTVTISIGAAEYVVDEGAESLIACADAQLYAAKRAGRDAIRPRMPLTHN